MHTGEQNALLRRRAVGRREQLRPSGRLGSSWGAVPEPAERRRTGTKVAERAGTWGLVQRSVFMRLVSRRVPRQSHRVEFARACVRFFEEKKREKIPKKTLQPHLIRSIRRTRREDRREDGLGTNFVVEGRVRLVRVRAPKSRSAK